MPFCTSPSAWYNDCQHSLPSCAKLPVPDSLRRAHFLLGLAGKCNASTRPQAASKLAAPCASQVPLWDMLNHATGKCNVRLHHDDYQGTLQMLATADIASGQELVNSYGQLSSTELLRCYG